MKMNVSYVSEIFLSYRGDGGDFDQNLSKNRRELKSNWRINDI